MHGVGQGSVGECAKQAVRCVGHEYGASVGLDRDTDGGVDDGRGADPVSGRAAKGPGARDCAYGSVGPDESDSVVVGVGDVQVAAGVDRDPLGVVKPGRGAHAVGIAARKWVAPSERSNYPARYLSDRAVVGVCHVGDPSRIYDDGVG